MSISLHDFRLQFGHVEGCQDPFVFWARTQYIPYSDLVAAKSETRRNSDHYVSMHFQNTWNFDSYPMTMHYPKYIKERNPLD